MTTQIPFGAFESSVQYGLESSANGYGLMPLTGSATKTMTGGLYTFGNLVKADPEIKTNRYKIRGLSSRSPRYTRMGNRAIAFNFSVNPQPVDVTYDTSYLYDEQNIIDLLCMAMGTAYNTTDDPNAAQWTTSNTPFLRNSIPSIFIEHIIKRRGAATVSNTQKWELGIGMACRSLTITAEIGKPMTCDVQLIGQDMAYITALTSSNKDYTKDAEQTSFGSGAIFGNTILSTDATTTTLRTATDATKVIAAPYAWFEQGFKYCYKTPTTGDVWDIIPAEVDYTSPTNIRSWKLNITNNIQSHWGLNADSRKCINYFVPTERDITLDFTANYEDTSHYLDMIKDSQIFNAKLRFGTIAGKSLRLINGKVHSAKYNLNQADMIALDTHVEFEARASGEDATHPYCEWVNWTE